ncbi:OsmC family protein [Chelativorans sp. AA-79]|uniref:OsmC family protein n=1 Tax=Chelativorans sp. AA-79 TaxID=3028735 RepID=UPI0023F8904A|nr:OsmC family protein [Chelativorans sp. AA-79]WEX08355.1 OsmC family protein [Chelativorans sp. AA-79]
MVNIVKRSTVVGAFLPGKGQGNVEARSGARLDLAGLATESGMTPVEMMDAALAGCLVLSARIAARNLGWHERLVSVKADVRHEKAPDAPSRVAAFDCAFQIEGDFSPEEREKLVAEAHRLCTVGNTLERGATIRDVERIPDEG